MTRLILIRHGETDWNVEGRYQGQADPPLNARGFDQAQELAQRLVGACIDVLYTSPLRRAADTAKVIAQQLHIPLQTEPRLMEIHQGDWQTRLRSDIETLYPDLFRRWEIDPWEVTPPDGEHLTEIQARVNAAIDDLIRRHPGQCIGVVTHRIPIALIKIHYQNLDAALISNMHLPNVYEEEIFLGA